MPLRWEPFDKNAQIAICGEVTIGMVNLKHDGLFHWKVDGIDIHGIAKRSGDVKTLATAKAAVERGWAKWLKLSGLTDGAK